MTTTIPAASRRVAALALLAALFTLPAHAADTQATTTPTTAADAAKMPLSVRSGQEGLFAILSDIHFDPFYDPSLVDKLASAKPSDWDAIFATSSIVRPATSGNDTNFPLFKSTLDSMSQLASRFDYVIFPGDFLSHDFQQNYNLYATDKSEAAYRAFVVKTMQYVANSLKARFPRVPVVAALGNNDSFCGDYMIEPAGAFLYDTTAAITKLAGRGTGLSSYPELGAYVIPHPKTPNHYFIVIDNLYFAANYRNACGLSFTDPSQALLLWLESTLYRMKRSNATTTLVVHVPSGINAYSSTNACSVSGSPKPYLAPSSGTGFLSIIQQYPAQVKAIFAGHSHMDDFRVIADDKGTPFTFQHVAPSISPIFGNNPGYEVYSYDVATATPVDYAARIFSRTKATGQYAWKWEYDFQADYGVGPLSATNLNTLAGKINNDPTVRAKFVSYYTGGANSGTITDSNWPAFTCALANLDPTAYSSCYCGNTQ